MSDAPQCSAFGVVYAADIGSTRGSRKGSGFGWYRVDPCRETASGHCIMALASAIASDLQRGHSVALGLEAPLTIPVPVDGTRLSYGRTDEGNRSFAAPPGLAVTALCLHQTAWLLSDVREKLGLNSDSVLFSYDPSTWPPSRQTLFCWEAFVSGTSHGADHVADARTAVHAFLQHEHDLASASTVHAERPLSVIGAAAMWSGWLTSREVLQTESVVIKPGHNERRS